MKTHIVDPVLGERIKKERRRLGMTQEDVARRCGVTRTTWAKYESGASGMGSTVLRAFVALGADADFLTTGHRREEFDRIAEPPPFYGTTADAKRQALLRYWGALPPELQAKVLDLSETLAHLYLHFDKRS